MDELNAGKVAYSFEGGGGGDFDRDGDAVVDDAGFVFVCISWESIAR